MASKLGEAFVELVAMDSKFRQSLKRAEGDTEKSTRTMKQHFQGLATSLAGIGAAIGVGVVLKTMTDEAMAAEVQQTRLASALALTGDASVKNMEQFQKFAESIQAVTVYEDDAIVGAMGYAKTLGIQTDQLQQVTKAAIGLAQITGKDLESAMLAVARAAKNEYGRLKMLIPAFEQTGDAAVDFANLLKLTEGGFSQASAYAGTTAGQFMQFKNAVGNLAETFGASLLPAMMMFAGVAKSVLEWVTNMNPAMRATILVIGGLVLVVSGAVVALGALSAAWGAVAANATAAAVAQFAARNQMVLAAGVALAVVGAIVGVSKAIGNADNQMKKFMDEMNKNSKKALGGMADGTKALGKAAGEASTRASNIAGDNRPVDIYEQQAQEIMTIYNNTRKARQEEEARQRSIIGFTGLAELYKGAAVAGGKARFPNQARDTDYERRMGFYEKDNPINNKDLTNAVNIYNEQKWREEKQLKILEAIRDSLRAGAYA